MSEEKQNKSELCDNRDNCDSCDFPIVKKSRVKHLCSECFEVMINASCSCLSGKKIKDCCLEEMLEDLEDLEG